MYYDPNLYQRQFSQQHNSTMLDNSYVADRERQSLSRQHSLTKSYNVYSESTRCANNNVLLTNLLYAFPYTQPLVVAMYIQVVLYSIF